MQVSYESFKLKDWMCELCTFWQIQSQFKYHGSGVGMLIDIITYLNDTKINFADKLFRYDKTCVKN